MDDFRRRIRYDVTKDTTNLSRSRRSDRKIDRPQKNNGHFNGKVIKRILALLLAAGTVAGISKGCKIIEPDEVIDTLKEVDEHNLNASNLQISPEIYTRMMEFRSKLEAAEQNDFSNISNSELIEYTSELHDLYLDILKSKVSTITGMDSSKFTLIAPSPNKTTLIKDKEKVLGIGISMNSSQVDDYMLDILDIENFSKKASFEDIDRTQLQNTILKYAKDLDGLATLMMGIEEKYDTRQIYTYYIKEKDISQARDDNER